jgi:hypothetical protein
MISRLLDPDLESTWSDIEAAVNEAWQEINIKFDLGEEQGKQFLNQLTCVNEFLADNLARSLRQKGREILYTRYSHVAGYHGCRPIDRTSYKTKGILPSNTNAVISQARTLFEGIEGLDEVIQGIKYTNGYYLKHNEGKVGLLYSELLAKAKRNRYALGSEFIRSIAFRLGPVAKSRYAETGKPTLIKCAIPVDWLDNHTMGPASGGYSNDVLAALIRMRMGADDSFIGFDGGYMLTRAVPPENILDFIDMTNFIDDEL